MKKTWAWWCVPAIPSLQEDCGPLWSRQKLRPYLQNNQRIKDMAQAVEHLTGKHETLSSNLSNQKKPKKH
jgi:hypothetical protein